jgi:hypothetical protein
VWPTTRCISSPSTRHSSTASCILPPPPLRPSSSCWNTAPREYQSYPPYPLAEAGIRSSGKADLTVIFIPNQPDRPLLPVPNGDAALSVCVRLPEANTLERLLALEAEPAGQGNGQPDGNFCLVAHTLARGNLCAGDTASSRRQRQKQRRSTTGEFPTSDFLMTLEPSAPCPV